MSAERLRKNIGVEAKKASRWKDCASKKIEKHPDFSEKELIFHLINRQTLPVADLAYISTFWMDPLEIDGFLTGFTSDGENRSIVD